MRYGLPLIGRIFLEADLDFPCSYITVERGALVWSPSMVAWTCFPPVGAPIIALVRSRMCVTPKRCRGICGNLPLLELLIRPFERTGSGGAICCNGAERCERYACVARDCYMECGSRNPQTMACMSLCYRLISVSPKTAIYYVAWNACKELHRHFRQGELTLTSVHIPTTVGMLVVTPKESGMRERYGMARNGTLRGTNHLREHLKSIHSTFSCTIPSLHSAM